MRSFLLSVKTWIISHLFIFTVAASVLVVGITFAILIPAIAKSRKNNNTTTVTTTEVTSTIVTPETSSTTIPPETTSNETTETTVTEDDSGEDPIEVPEINEEEHIHTYSDSWEKDDKTHWHESTCGHSLKKDEEKHDYELVTTPASFESSGEEKYTCKVCGYSYSVVLEKLEYSYSTKAELCEEDNNYHCHYCTDSGHTDSYIDKAEHTFTQIVLDSTYDEAGYVMQLCEECGYSYKEYDLQPKPHTYNDWYDYDEFNHWNSCCDKGYESLKAFESSHRWATEVVSASYDHQGYSKTYCFDCGYISEYIFYPALQYPNYSDEYSMDETYHWYECIDADPLLMNLESGKEPHDFGAWVVSTPASDCNDGVISRSCSKCGYVEEHITPCNLTFELDEGGNNYLITGYNGDIVNLKITKQHNGKDIIGIKKQAFTGCTSLVSVDLEDASSLRSIGDYAFANCTNLKNINAYFAYNIGQYAFYNCSSLEEAWFSDQTTSIKKFTFYNCNKFETLCFTDEDTVSTHKYEHKGMDDVLYVGDYAFYNNEKINSLKLSSLLTVGNGAFAGCKGLTKIEFPQTCDSIGSGALNGCSNLQLVTIPFVGKSSESTGGEALFGYIFGEQEYEGGYVAEQYYAPSQYCRYVIPTKLETINLFGTNLNYGAFSNMSSIKQVYLPNNILVLPKLCFYNCTSLQDVNIPDNLVNIEDYAFYKCTSLKSPTLNASLKTIGLSSFAYTSFSSIVLPDSLLSIDRGAFYQNESLATITIPVNVYRVGEMAFAYNTNLITVNWNARNVTNEVDYNSSVFYGSDKIKTLSFGELVETIPSGAFANIKEITKITIPENVVRIEDGAFIGCQKLKIVQWEAKNAVYAGSKDRPIFANCSSLETLNIGSKVIALPNYVFYNVFSLQGINFVGNQDNSVLISIGSYAFYNCNKMTYIHLNLTLETIGEGAFDYCTSVTKVTVYSPQVRYEGKDKSPFETCKSITTVEFKESVRVVTKNFLRGCYFITSVNFKQNSITDIEDYALYHLYNLESISLPSSVQTIGLYSLAFMYKVKTVEIGYGGSSSLSNLTRIDKFALAGLNALETLRFNNTSQEWRKVTKDKAWYSGTPLTADIIFLGGETYKLEEKLK